jgi:signal transduction histidine kinase
MAEELDKRRLAQLRHQLRTPLNHIIGYSEILLEEGGADDDGERRAWLANVHASARVVLELVQQILSPADGQVTDVAVDALRTRMQEPTQSIVRNVNLIMEQRESRGPPGFASDQ